MQNPYFTAILGLQVKKTRRIAAMAHVTSGELQKKFGRYRSIAHREAVIVTSHGVDDLALISAEEYKRLRELENRAFPVTALSDDELADLDKITIPAEASNYNHETLQD